MDKLNNIKVAFKQMQEVKPFNKDIMYNFIDTTIQKINPKVRIYYNLSVNDFEQILMGVQNYNEFKSVISNIDHHMQYTFFTANECEDYIDYLRGEKEYTLINHLRDCKREINDNLFEFATDKLQEKHWIENM